MLKTQKNKKLLFLLFGFIVFSVSLLHIFNSFQWKEIFLNIKNVNLYLFIAGSVFSLCLIWLTRSLRWYVLLRDENKSVPFFKLYLYTAITLSLSTITPFQSGEALKVELLKKHNAGRISGYTNFAIERVVDLVVVLGFAAFGLSGQLNNQLASYVYLIAFSLISFCVISILLILFFPTNRFGQFRQILRERMKISILAKVIALTIFSWGFTALGWHFALQSIGIYLDSSQITLVVSLTTLASILSFVPGAVGVSELSISQILAQFGYHDNLAQSGALIIRGFALMILILGFIHWIILKWKDKKIAENN